MGPQGLRGEVGPQGPQGPGVVVENMVEQPGGNCQHGGVRIRAGADGNGNRVLEEHEVDPSSTQYLCNGAPGSMGAQGIQGPTGEAGPTGPSGAQGPQGEPGALALYGDGSAGDFTHFSTSPLRNLAIGYGSLANGANLMFRNVRIDGTLILASGTTIRATGDIIIGPTGVIAINPEQQVQSVNSPDRGIATSAAEDYQGGRGLDLGRSALLTRFDLRGGGGGFRPKHGNTTNAFGGEAGGRLILAARGNIIINGNIDAAGRTAQLTGGQPLAGGGGGGGGVVTLVSRGTITLGANGFIRANGGNGANGIAGAPGQLYGGGGGGGGGIVQFLTASAPSIANASNIVVTGGTVGNAGVSGAATTLVAVGGGGGASGGDGGDGTKSTVAGGAAEPGNTGDFSTTVTPQPELIFY
ncbi:collagen-like protein [Pyxidicoccus xibeiensis]|uniref:collagen-like protein n=1 Tax=Pyxidicoccus xibeiensis TaxID=2906759 RepID=UPI0020A7B73F|nr:collagen-like protein [Pyxidicoccus xibeiensis]MCP3139391.1 collagen-like protein [Pyxidicoccus xibeiensis]